MAASHTVDVVVTGVFKSVCSGLDAIVKQSQVDAARGTHQFAVTGALAPTACRNVGPPVRKTFVLETLVLAPNAQVPFVTVNGIRALRSAR